MTEIDKLPLDLLSLVSMAEKDIAILKSHCMMHPIRAYDSAVLDEFTHVLEKWSDIKCRIRKEANIALSEDKNGISGSG